MNVRIAALAALVTSAAVAGCGGSSPSAAGRMGLVAAPASISPGNAEPAQILVTGVHGTVTVSIADRTLADISPAIASGSAVSFTVTPVGGGTTTITVSDSSGNSIAIPASFGECLPPVPVVSLLAENVVLATPSPAPGAGTQPVRYSTIFVASPTAAASFVPSFSLRLIGSDGSTFEGAPLGPASGAPAATGATPAPAPSGDAEFFSAAPPLTAGTAYRVQLLGEHCLPPDVIGSFST